MPQEEQYLVRGPDGRMATVNAHSVRGALNLYLAKYRPADGSLVSVKPRGHGDWADYKVTR